MEQSTLTEFYRSRKRPIEGSHASKRRKIIQTEAEETVEVQREPECVRITRQRSRTTTTWKPARKTRKPRTKKVSDIAEDSSNLKAFLKAGMKEIPPVEVVSEITSINDNHQSDTASSKEAPSLKETRRRKVQTKRKENNNESQALEENSDNTEKRDILKVRTAKRNQTSKATTEEKRIVEPTQMKDSVVEKSVEKSGEHTTDKTPTSHPSSLLVRAKTPMKTSSSGLKINPWIAEQSNKVLLSRGQSALLLSQENASSKTKPRKAGVSEKHLLTKTKAQEGLEKARELIKKMRSLESDASKSRETSTLDKSERLHKLIKRPTAARGDSDKSTSSPTKAPAHERFHSLAQPTPPPSATTVTLPLPYKYKVLAEMFTCCDTILNLLGQRKENCTFKKLKESVEQMCRKRFDKHHLSQLIFVFPASYDLQHTRNNPKSSSYQLMIQFCPIKNSKDNRLTLPTTELLSRKKFFLEMLLVTTKGHHQDFIKSLELPLYIDDDKIIRWHPQFKLDSVPDIGQATLPEAPVVKTFTSAQDVLDRGRGSIAPRVEKALVYAATKSREKSKIDSQPKADENKSNISKVKNNNALKGVSQDLINKIKQKEAKKLEEALMRNPVLDQKMIMQERLPELCRILKTYFTAEKRATIPLEDATVKLSESYKSSISPGQVLEHLNLLSEIIPEWFSVLTVRKCPFVKINRKTDINSVIKKVTQKELK